MKSTKVKPASDESVSKAASAAVAKALKTYSVAALADKLGVTRDTIARWATGLNLPPLSRASKILEDLKS